MLMFQVLDKMIYNKGTWSECRTLLLVVINLAHCSISSVVGYYLVRWSLKDEKADSKIGFLCVFMGAGLIFLMVISLIFKRDIR